MDLFHLRDEIQQPLFLGSEDLPASRRDPVVRPSPGVISVTAAGRFGDEPFVDEHGEVTIERCGLDAYLTTGLFTNGLHHGVAVAVAVSERDQDVNGCC